MMPSILLIEDAPQVAGILVSKLGREGYPLTWVRDRAAAFQALEKKAFELIVLSTYLLPARDAWPLLAELKAHERFGGIPVVMLLQAEEAGEKDRALAAGAAGVIQKPFKPTQVAKAVRALLPLPAG